MDEKDKRLLDWLAQVVPDGTLPPDIQTEQTVPAEILKRMQDEAARIATMQLIAQRFERWWLTSEDVQFLRACGVRP